MDQPLTTDDRHDDIRMADMALADARLAALEMDTDRVRRALQQVYEHGSSIQVARARTEAALLELRDGRQDAAVALLRQADKLVPATRDGEFLFELAAAWQAVGHPSCAATVYKRALDVLGAPRPGTGLSPRDEPPPDATIRHQLAYAYLRSAELELERGDESDPYLAEEFFRAARKMHDPSVSPFACIELARSPRLNPPPAAIIEWLLREAIAYDHPEASPRAGVELGRLLQERKRYEAARDVLELVRDESGHEEWTAEAEAVLAALPAPTHPSPQYTAGEEPVDDAHRRRIIIAGAGTGGQYLYESLQDPVMRERYEVVGFVDDDETYGRGIPGVEGESSKYLGTLRELRRNLVERDDRPHAVWLAMPIVPPAVKRRVAFACADAGIPVLTLPTMHDLVRGRNLRLQLREVRVDDVIGANAVRVNHNAARWLRACRVMVVGCGTLGKQLARKAADAGADALVLVDRDDHALARLRHELSEAREFHQVSIHHASAVDGELLVELAREHGVDVMLYAAVTGWAGVNRDRSRQSRILRGIRQLVETLPVGALDMKRMVWISDASVALPDTPARALAAIAEAIATLDLEQSDASGLVRCAVRIPAMYTSRNSIIAALEDQARLGIELRVPPPPATQRFIHAYEAAELVLQAARIARPRETLAVDRGEDVPLHQLAEWMLRLRGLVPDHEAAIVNDPELVVDDPPRPVGDATEVEGVLSLRWPYDVPALRTRVEELTEEPDLDVLAFARRHLAKLRTESADPQRREAPRGDPQAAPSLR